MTKQSQLWVNTALVLLIAAALGVYWQGLTGSFLVDDNNTLVALNHNGGVTNWSNALHFISTNNSGVLGRPLAMASFLIDDQYYPGDVRSYRYTNIMIHLLCGLALFLFFTRFLEQLKSSENTRFAVALLALAWWWLAPINVSTTLYIVQRMTQLSALFTVVGLLLFLVGRGRLMRGEISGFWLSGIGLFGFGCLAVLCKENGALIFVYAAVIEATLCFTHREKSHPWVVVAIGGPLLVLVGYFIANGARFTNSYINRDFTMAERLLTETRIVATYLAQSVFSATAKMGLMQDDIVLSKSLTSPLSTLFSLLLHVALLSGAWFYRYRLPLLFFAVAWFYGGHLLESTYLPLELYFEHRNYLPIAGLFLGLIALAWRAPKLAGYPVAKVVIVLLVINAALSCIQRAALWGQPDLLMRTWIYEHPSSLRAQTIHARNLIRDGDYENAYKQIEGLKSHWPEALHVDLLLLNQQCLNNMPRTESASRIINGLSERRYYYQLDAVLKNTAMLAKDGKCSDWLNPVIHPLLQGVVNLNKVPKELVASAAFWEHEVFIAQSDLNGAVLSLERSFNYYKDSIPRYLQAKLLASAGLYDEADTYIKEAIALELSRPEIKRKHLDRYQLLEQKIEESLRR